MAPSERPPPLIAAHGPYRLGSVGSPVHQGSAAPSFCTCAPARSTLCTGATEGAHLHAPLELRISTVGPGKQGSITHAEYLSELLESVPEHKHSPLSAEAADVLPLPCRCFASAQRAGRTGHRASLRPSRRGVSLYCFPATTATATSSRLHD